ncbi:hypothetical protein PATSB16_35050 [Pandoraea thiooxydans]|uniref:SURF1-like protein n=1 Tax=Pandoraea thiooxydans TaxID=445709 RepID=A0A0G3EV40_9BURK|nr:SURF1 family protein [Pandoraea thiooxydans]AKJ69237.1 hypothetical protein ABW99_14485 [Pandoraea thiooxydans]APR96841.1 hypothetical protein PATSB16_35050 [Pandoraea thiooxydans]
MAVFLGIALTCGLGVWQLQRAHERLARQARIDQWADAAPIQVGRAPLSLSAVAYHRVRVVGRFLPERAVYLDNRPHNGLPGFYVVMPLEIDGSGAPRYVLVNRGWLPRDLRDRTAIMPYPTPVGLVEVEGIARANPSRAFELGNGSPPGAAIRQNLDVAAYEKETGLTLQPFVIMQTSPLNDHLIRDWPKPTMDVARNYGYAAQWFGLALVLLLMSLRMAYKRGRAVIRSAEKTPNE